MATKRRRIARNRASMPLTFALTDLLLTGHTRSGPEVAALHAEGIEYDQWIMFDDIDTAPLWRAHRAALMAEWKRRGEVGRPSGAPADVAL